MLPTSYQPNWFEESFLRAIARLLNQQDSMSEGIFCLPR